jgi:hypothetical protein
MLKGIWGRFLIQYNIQMYDLAVCNNLYHILDVSENKFEKFWNNVWDRIFIWQFKFELESVRES